MNIKMYPVEQNEHRITEALENYDDNGNKMSWMSIRTIDSRYCGKLLKTVAVSGIATYPQYRRGGAVRAMLDMMFDLAPERGWAVSLLHPFSFSYYRKFGYEKVADHKVLEFPIAKLEFVERCPDFVPVESVKTAEDAVSVYNEFSKNKNIMFPRYDTWHFHTEPHDDPQKTYLHYDANGKPDSYVTYSQEQYYNVNVMTSVALHVHEICFTTPASLRAVFGFLRMFEGEDNTVIIHNAAMSPEVDTVLKHYMHTKYTQISDLAARVFDVKAVLEASSYPIRHGGFTVNIIDTLPYTKGTYEVEFQNGVAEARRIATSATADIVAPMPAFTQLVYGYEEYTPTLAAFMDGVTVNNPSSDFFDVFHKKQNGLFEHF